VPAILPISRYTSLCLFIFKNVYPLLRIELLNKAMYHWTVVGVPVVVRTE